MGVDLVLEKNEQAELSPSRRELLTGSAKKLKYVIPVIWVLGAAPETAFASGAPASATCKVSGLECGNHAQCCLGLCFNQGMGLPMVCKEP